MPRFTASLIWVASLAGDDWHELTVTAVTRNYIFNYVYVGKEAYANAWGEQPAYNRYYAVEAGGHTSDEVSDYLKQADSLGSISFVADLAGNIRQSINSVTNILWILIVSAGLLAFVVIYNLTTINVGERVREIATLKVLGFTDRETYAYVFHEIWITTAVGMVGGWFLYLVVLNTVEPDMVLFLREVSLQSYAAAVLAMLVFTWLVNQFVKPQIRDIDMLESLKSVE